MCEMMSSVRTSRSILKIDERLLASGEGWLLTGYKIFLEDDDKKKRWHYRDVITAPSCKRPPHH